MITSLLVKIHLHLPNSSRVVQRHLGPALRHLEPLAVPVVGNSGGEGSDWVQNFETAARRRLRIGKVKGFLGNVEVMEGQQERTQ